MLPVKPAKKAGVGRGRKALPPLKTAALGPGTRANRETANMANPATEATNQTTVKEGQLFSQEAGILLPKDQNASAPAVSTCRKPQPLQPPPSVRGKGTAVITGRTQTAAKGLRVTAGQKAPGTKMALKEAVNSEGVKASKGVKAPGARTALKEATNLNVVKALKGMESLNVVKPLREAENLSGGKRLKGAKASGAKMALKRAENLSGVKLPLENRKNPAIKIFNTVKNL